MEALQAKYVRCAPVAQLDRALASEARGRAFESPRARHFPPCSADARRSAVYTFDSLYGLATAVTTGSTNCPKWQFGGRREVPLQCWVKIRSEKRPQVPSSRRQVSHIEDSTLDCFVYFVYSLRYLGCIRSMATKEPRSNLCDRSTLRSAQFWGALGMVQSYPA